VLIAMIRERDAGLPIVINSVMPRAAKFADDIEVINGRYREIAAEFDATYLDLWPVLAAPDRSLRSELTPDGLHLNSDGYREWSALLRPVLERIARDRQR
jgi:lysophospholipase L1-like esterase